jgi:hypothetical protein
MKNFGENADQIHLIPNEPNDENRVVAEANKVSFSPEEIEDMKRKGMSEQDISEKLARANDGARNFKIVTRE